MGGNLGFYLTKDQGRDVDQGGKKKMKKSVLCAIKKKKFFTRN
jgi:hypothetical protein